MKRVKKSQPFSAVYPLVAVEIALSTKDLATFSALATLCGEHGVNEGEPPDAGRGRVP